jgi:hypothetical protein
MVDDNVHDLHVVDDHTLSRLPGAGAFSLPVLVNILLPVVVLIIVVILNGRLKVVVALRCRVAGPAAFALGRPASLGLLLLLLSDEFDLAQELGQEVFCGDANVQICVGKVFAAEVSFAGCI